MTNWIRAIVSCSVVQVFLMTPGNCTAQETEDTDTLQESGYLQVYFEQDMWIPTDQNYTMGVGIEAMGDWSRWKYNPQYQLDKVIGSIPYLRLIPDPQARVTHSLMLFGTAFTPDSIEAAQPVEGDRPYASLLGVVSSRTWVRGRYSVTTQLGIGLLGLDIAPRIQEYIHRRRNVAEPQGWRHQISDNGGELTGIYQASLRTRLFSFSLPATERKVLDSTLDKAFSLGYYTNANAGMTFRFGCFVSDFSDGPAPRLRVGREFVNGAAPVPFEFYGFASARTTLVGYNALLQGGRKATTYRLASSAISRQVTEFEVGFRISFRRVYGAFAHAGRSPEFDTDLSRWHYWSSIRVGIPFWG